MSKLVTNDNLKAYHAELAEHIKLLQRNTAYVLDDIVNYDGITLKCTTAGTTNTTKPNISTLSVGSTYTDGTCVWTRVDLDKRGIDYYVASKDYDVDDQVVYNNNIYRCITAHTSTSTFDNAKWTEISAGGGGGISIWQANTDYEVNDVVIDSNLIWQCAISHTSSTTFDESKWICISGGEISSGMKYETLWEGEAGSYSGESTITINLSEPINKYKKIGFCCIANNPANNSKKYYYREITVLEFLTFLTNAESNDSFAFCWGYGSKGDNIEINGSSSNSQLVILFDDAKITKIIGISEGVVIPTGVQAARVTLWEGSVGNFSGATNYVPFDLLDDFTNYDVIGFYIYANWSGTKRYIYREVNKEQIVDYINSGVVNDTVSFCWGYGNASDYCDIAYNSTPSRIYLNVNQAVVTKIIGIKYIQPDSYSTEEKLIGTWIDGKPLYRKVFENPTNGMSTGLTNFNARRIYGEFIDINVGNYLPIPWNSGSFYVGAYINSVGVVTIQSSISSPNVVWVAIEYTKN